jgi:Zn-dependent protease with chaperone function
LAAGTLRWLRAAELSCDRAALLVSQNPRTVVSVIMKLSGGGSSFAKDLNPDDYMRQALDFEQERYADALSSPLTLSFSSCFILSLSPPPSFLLSAPTSFLAHQLLSPSSDTPLPSPLYSNLVALF